MQNIFRTALLYDLGRLATDQVQQKVIGNLRVSTSAGSQLLLRLWGFIYLQAILPRIGTERSNQTV